MHLINGSIVPDPRTTVSQNVLDRLREFRLEEGDVVLGRRGVMGRAAVVRGLETGWLCGTGSLILRQLGSIVPDYLQRFLSSPSVVAALDGASVGSTMVNLNQAILKSLEIPLAPLNEQRRIAAKLDTTLAAVEACRQRLDGVAAILKRFRQAVLAAATSGELTREWREERSGSLNDWAHRRVEDVVTAIEAGLNVQCEERPPEDHERGLVKISAVTWGIYDEQESKTLSKSAVVLEKNRIQVGDFLISRANTIELVGSCVLVDKTSRNLYLSDKVLRLVMPQEWKLWLLWCLKSPAGRKQIEKLSSGNQLSMRNLSQKSLLSISIQLPPADELEKIVTVINDLLSLADQLEARLNAARKIVDRLTPALLAKAFRGELVPQDPNDEPASVLLERLAATRRAARQAEAGAGRSSRRGRPKAAANPDQLPLDAAPVPPDFLAALLRECGALSERALLAVSELEPERFEQQLLRELERGTAREVQADGQVLLEAVS
jgi:type I restriction enzyme S subunit